MSYQTGTAGPITDHQGNSDWSAWTPLAPRVPFDGEPV